MNKRRWARITVVGYGVLVSILLVGLLSVSRRAEPFSIPADATETPTFIPGDRFHTWRIDDRTTLEVGEVVVVRCGERGVAQAWVGTVRAGGARLVVQRGEQRVDVPATCRLMRPVLLWWPGAQGGERDWSRVGLRSAAPS